MSANDSQSVQSGCKQRVLVNVILDKSGSMCAKVQDVIGGFNLYLDELAKEPAVYRYKSWSRSFVGFFRSRVIGAGLCQVHLVESRRMARSRLSLSMRNVPDAPVGGVKTFSICSRSQRFAGSFSTLSCQYR